MFFINFVVVFGLAYLIQSSVGELPKFRILAPPFVCPKDKDAVMDKPDNTVITMKTEPGVNVDFHWVVRWYPLTAPTQRFTLALWRTVRQLELKLNKLPLEPNVFVINNTELLPGVHYIFNITATSTDEEGETEQVFFIDNVKGDPKLLLEGRSDKFSVVLIGGQLAYADIEFILEAQVTICRPTQNYYFVWSVTNAKHNVTVSAKGSRLVILPHTLTPGLSYKVLCQVYKFSNGKYVTQSSLPIQVLHRNLSIHFNVDLLLVSIGTPFKLYTDINKLDYTAKNVAIIWQCKLGDELIDTLYKTDGAGTLSFPLGLSSVGEYSISVTVTVVGTSISGQAFTHVTVVEPSLPVIKVFQEPRVLNEDTEVVLKANVTNMVPGCSVSWYFIPEYCLDSDDDCDGNEHGTPISAPVNFYSLEENFLSELTDYTNETGWKAVDASLKAEAGRARVVAECVTVREDNSTLKEEVYADVAFEINDKPTAGYVLVQPEVGTAMETVFRLSTIALVDPNRPLRYSFYCDMGNNETLLLGSYLEHLAVETLLPFIGGITFVFVEVCDSLGACSTGSSNLVLVAPGEARTVDALLQDAQAHLRRCELLLLRRLTTSAIATYRNANQEEALAKFSDFLAASGDVEKGCMVKG